MSVSSSTVKKLNIICKAHGYSVVAQGKLPNPEIDCSRLLSVTEQKTRKNFLAVRIARAVSNTRSWNESLIQEMRDLVNAARIRKVGALVIICPNLGENTPVEIRLATEVLEEAMEYFADTEEGQTHYWELERKDILDEIGQLEDPLGFVPVLFGAQKNTDISYRSIVRTGGEAQYAFATKTAKNRVFLMPYGHSEHKGETGGCGCIPIREILAEEWNSHASIRLANGHDSHRMMVFDADGFYL